MAMVIERLHEYRDWKFYCALAAALTLAGAGAYLLTAHRRSTKDSSESSQYIPEENDEVVINYEDMTDEDIRHLGDAKRKEIADIYRLKGNDMFRGKQYEEALEYYTCALKFWADAAYYSNRAACYLSRSHYDKVIDDCNRALSLDPTYSKVLTRRGQAHEKKGQLMEALKDYTLSTVDGDPNNPDSKMAAKVDMLLDRIMADRKTGLPSTADIRSELNAYHPVWSEPAVQAGDETSGDAWYGKAYKATLCGDYAAGYEASRAAVQAQCSPAYEAHALNLYGTYEYLAGAIDEARECFKKAVQLYPEYTQCHIKLANMYIKRHKVAYALTQFDEVASRDPSNPDVFFHRGNAHYLSGHYDLAEEDYRRCLALDPTFLYAHIHLADTLHRQERSEDAVATFEFAVSSLPPSTELCTKYGTLLIDLGRATEAEAMLDRAIHMDPVNPQPLIQKAKVVADEEAMKLYLTALQVYPTYNAAIQLAEIHQRNQRLEDAQDYYLQAADLAKTEIDLDKATQKWAVCTSLVQLAKKNALHHH